MNKDLLKLVELGIIPWDDFKKMLVDYNTAMAKCQGEIKPIKKETSSNIFKYAKYEDIREQTKSLLDKHGIEIEMWPICQDNDPQNDKFFLKIRIGHIGGYFEERTVPLIIPKQNAGRLSEEQLFGKATTYAKRYVYCTILGIATYEKDLDDKETNTTPIQSQQNVTPIDKNCPKCGKGLVQRESANGPFIGCSGYPNCKFTVGK